ncbi:hypothetical protein GCM10009846_02810 [Agrococcus versicolor]|uniref:DUF1129 domain-containing protein n=1 Tax=Agrococcus versicolor TaxID=501482 RepID=A0ABP5M9B0_9MICO
MDAAWAEALIVELRLRGVSGATVGDALLEVETHMAEQGGSVVEAFGEAKEYAASLDLPDTARWTAPQVVRVCAQSALVTLGIQLLVGGAAALASGGDARIAIGTTVALVLSSVVVALALVAKGEVVLRLAVERPVLGILLLGGASALVVLLAVALAGPALALPAVPVLGAGILLLGGFGALMLVARRRGSELDDPIRFPQA